MTKLFSSHPRNGAGLLPVLIAAALALPNVAHSAQEFRARNDMLVRPLNAYEFEVIGDTGHQKEEYWCGIGDFARRGLGLPYKDRIYAIAGITNSVTGGSRSAARFTLDLEKSSIAPYTNNLVTNVLAPGYGRSVNAASSVCLDPEFSPFFRR